jgi:hypothetical protein
MPGAKGNGGEREVARKLEPWWRKVEPTATFIRTPQSGGWSTVQVRQEFRASGDIMTTGIRFPFAVEVKRREGWSPANFVAGKKSPVWGWWREAQVEAAELGAEPMLWVRKNAERRRGKGSGGGTLPPLWTVLLRRDYVLELCKAGSGNVITPDIFWHVDTLGVGVDIGDAMPVGFVEHSLLGTDPAKFALKG